MDNEQELVTAILKSLPPPDVRGDFLARVNARIDATEGWLGLADFRAWTLRLAPAAAALALLAVFWPASAATPASTESTSSGDTSLAVTFTPSSSSDWQQDVSADAMIDAALSPRSSGNAR